MKRFRDHGICIFGESFWYYLACKYRWTVLYFDYVFKYGDVSFFVHMFPIPCWKMHFDLLFLFWPLLFLLQNFDELTVAMTVAYLLITLTSIGLLSEGNPFGSYFELARCTIFLYLSSNEDYFLQGALRIYFLPSLIVWVIYLTHQFMICYRAELKEHAFILGTKLNAHYQDDAPVSKIYNGKSNFCLVENTSVKKVD